MNTPIIVDYEWVFAVDFTHMFKYICPAEFLEVKLLKQGIYFHFIVLIIY